MMRASVCVLVCMLSVCSALICPDGGMCDEGNTCCQTPWGGYGCCPLPNAKCCSDHLHCCHEGTLCDMEHGKCVNKTHTLEWVRRVITKQTSLPRAVVCPDQKSECPDDTTCCQMPDGTWGCCPMPNAVCCEDKRHCCPEGTTCDIPHSKCVLATLGSIPLLRKFPTIRKEGSKSAAGKEISVKFPDSNDVICPDKVSTCPDDTTCCILTNKSYGCCPMLNAMCCDDHVHCCPEGTTCDLEHDTCIFANELTAMAAEAPPLLRLKPTVDSVPCNDSVACVTGYTCCKNQESEWACCPLLEAVCCEDHIHCCPHGTICDLSEGTCDDSVDPSRNVPLVKKVSAFPRPSQPANQKCDQSFSCLQDATCCRMVSGGWGCCPLPQAVCCADRVHCCPHDTVCNLAAGTCNRVPDAGVRLTVPWVSKTPAVALGSENECCDETSTCPAGTTCCKERSGTWACCPLPQAVCCEDHEHCCPQGYKCDVAHKSCEHPSVPSMPWIRKQSTLSVSHSSCADSSSSVESGSQHGHKCDAQTSCPRGNTCCYMAKLSKWGCCPLPQAVCCGDGDHCCPSGYTCDKEKPVCVKGNLQIPWFKKQPAMSAQGSAVTHGLGDVKCDTTTSCAAGTTCCRLNTGKWGCCPLVKAVCCEDHKHCCPHDYTCDLQSRTCIKPSTTHTVPLALMHALSDQDGDEVMCDATRRCSKSQTCCRTPDAEWACCPFEQAVCCKDMQHCCPKGYNCDPEKRCTKASPLTCKEEDDDSLTEMESLPRKISEKDTGITTVIAQADAEQCQEICPSSLKHGLLQRQHVASFRRTCPRKRREGARRQKEHSEFGRPLWRTSARKKSLKTEDERRAPVEKPFGSVASPSISRFEVSCCSNIYTSVGGSPELGSHPESEYIFAESIKGCDISCSSVSQDWGSLSHHTEVQKTCSVMQDPRFETAKIGSSIEALFGSDSSCDGVSIRGDGDSDSSNMNADWEQSIDSDNDSCNLVYSFAEPQWGSAASCSGSAASGYITDYDLESSFSTIEQRDSSDFCSHFEAGHYDCSFGQYDAGHSDLAVEARHCDSAGNHFEGGYHDSPVSHFKPGHHNLPDGYFEAGHLDLPIGHSDTRHCDSPVGCFDAGHRDLPVRRFLARDCGCLVGHFEAEHHSSPVGHSEEGRRASPVEIGHCDSPVGHFEAGHCDSPVGHFEAGHCDSPVGHYEAGHCDSPDGHFEEASCDLYNAVPESSDEVCYRAEDHNYLSYLKDNSELTWRTLLGVRTHPDRYRVAPFFHEMMNETEHNGNQEKGKINKGFLFHPQRFLQAKNSEYREGQEYSMLRHLQNGSFGDVFSVRDKQTGFTCAVKMFIPKVITGSNLFLGMHYNWKMNCGIPLSSFSWEEVETWGRLNSPRVLQLYGAVQEGLNVVLFMDLKTGSLAQFLKTRGHFPEDLALYYHYQVLQALEHLHSRKVIHLDVKVDNVLLSNDKMECFLCDFGLSEMLDKTGYSTKTFRGNGLRGTESHMSPEVARGDPRSDKADVWSSCCMLLHMLSGHQPWTRYYTHPLCLKIVSEQAPLWEIPSGCDPLTCDVIRGGLVKDPRERDSAKELLGKSSRALRAGGYFDPVQSSTPSLPRPQISLTMPSHNVLPKPQMVPFSVSMTTIPRLEELSAPRIQWVSGWREHAAEEDWTDSEDTYGDSDEGLDGTEGWMEESWGLRNEYRLSEDENNTGEEMMRSSEAQWRERAAVEKGNEEEGESDEEMESDVGSLRELGSEDEWEPLHRLQILYGSNRPHGGDVWCETEEECVSSAMTSLNLMNSCERNSRLTLTCHRSACTTDTEPTDKASDWSDDLSSGVFSSYSSLTDKRSFNVAWSVSTNHPHSCSFEGLGVDIWVEDVNGNTFRIRERRKVKLGHVATGISAQISMRAFSLATLDGKMVSPDAEVLESRTWLLCVPAPDNGTNWTWRIRDGKIETQEADEVQSDTASTVAA